MLSGHISRLREHRRAAAFLAVIAGALVFAAAALASGSFTWTAHFNSNLRSRDYSTPNSGTHKITSTADCHNWQMNRSYQVEVWRNIDFWPDHSYGRHTYYCGETDATSWSIGDTGTFHFDLHKALDGAYFDLTGTTVYP
jgi:hypothetical protein